MATYLITYNLNDHDDDYEDLFAAIDDLGDTWHDASKLDSVWFVKTTMTATTIRNQLRSAMDRDDNCVIVDISGQTRNGWMPKDFWSWLKDT